MISIIIPAYNEENAIPATVREIREVLSQAALTSAEIILVNDGSTDNTSNVAKNHGVKVIDHPHNIGYGRSLKDGIRAATHDIIVITDADRTYPFREVPKLLEMFGQGFDMVVGARTGDHYRESWYKSPLRSILKFLVEFTAGRKIPDINSGLRIFRRSTILPYFDHLCETFSFTTSMTLAYMMTGRFVGYLPIPYEKRLGQSKVRLFRDSLRTLQYILQAINYYNPLKIFFLFFLGCLGMAAFSFLLSFLYHIKAGYILGIGCLLMSLVILCTGLIADLLKQIMNKS